MSTALAPVVNWIRIKQPAFVGDELDLDLIANRVIDSLDFMELILLLEDITEQEIEMETLDVTTLRTLRGIQDNFLS